MPLLLIMLASIGMSFWLQYKVFALFPGMHRISDCSYCIGWWTGWVTWSVFWMTEGRPMFGQGSMQIILGGACWAFAAAASNYFFDAIVARLERYHG